MAEKQETRPATQAAPQSAAQTPFEGGHGAYLLRKGWTPLGDPNSMLTRWLEPEAVLVESRKKVPVMMQGRDGQMEPIQGQDGYGKLRPNVQTEVTFPSPDYEVDVAMRLQMGRDREALAKQRAG